MANNEPDSEGKEPVIQDNQVVTSGELGKSYKTFISEKLIKSNNWYNKYIFGGALLLIVLLVLILLGATTSSGPITDTWTGRGKDNNWSTASNWSKGVPKSGDSLIFNTISSKKQSIYNLSNNDLGDEVFNSIKFVGNLPYNEPFRITGQTFDVSGGVIINSTTPVIVNSLKLAANQSLNTLSNKFASINLGLNLNGHSININNAVITLSKLQGAGSIVLNKGELGFDSNDKNNPGFNGNITINASSQLALTLAGNSNILGQGSVNINNGAQLLMRLNNSSTIPNNFTFGSTKSENNQPMIQASSNVLSSSSKSSTLTLTLSGNLTLKNDVSLATTSAGSGLVPVSFVLTHKPSGNFKIIPVDNTVNISYPKGGSK